VAGRSTPRDLHVVLLAGGSGTRFWPQSRKRHPKQFLALSGGDLLLLETWKRVRKLVGPAKIWVVAPRPLVQKIRKALPQLRKDRLIVEPSPRDTGPAVGLACAAVSREQADAVVAIFPTDHVVERGDRFVTAVRRAAAEARRGALVCLGVRPSRPATGFGYLRCARKPIGAAAVEVSRFVEKPNATRAKRFLRSGLYLWNAGMFVWKAEAFLDEMRRVAPEMERAVRQCAAGKRSRWNDAPRLSVDYAVMEKAKNVRVVPLDAGWDDVGSWDAAARLAESKGRIHGEQIKIDSADSVIFGDRRLIALIDVPGVTVVDTPDALLVVSRESGERVKEVVEELKRRKREELL